MLSIQEMLVAEHGGRLGIRDAGALEDAIARPKHLVRGGVADIPILAASYAIEIVRSRPMIDRNVRLALGVFGTFLELCDFGLNVDRGDALRTFVRLEHDERSDEAFLRWARDYAVQRRYR